MGTMAPSTARRFLLLNTLCIVFGLCDATEQLHVLLMSSSSDRLNSSGAVQSAQMALSRVNSMVSLLPGYELILTKRDTKCDGSTSVREFLTSALNPNSSTFIGVIGCGCSVATEPVADIISLYGLPLISFTSSTMGLRSHSLMPSSQISYYQLFPSDNNLVTAIVALLEEYEWSQVSIITEKEDLFLQLEDRLYDTISSANISVLNPTHFSVCDEEASKTCSLPANRSYNFAEDARIFIVNSYENKARQLLCEAYQRNNRMKYPDYAWILYGWYSEEWWRSTSDVNCSGDELAIMLERALVIQQYPIADNISTNSVGGLTHDEILSLQRIGSSPFVETLTFDSVWTLALALNRTMNMINTSDTLDCGPSPVPLEEFSYGNSSTACLIRNSLSATNFIGLSGEVTFTQHGVREIEQVRLMQYRNFSDGIRLVQFGYVSLDSLERNVVYIAGESNATVWGDNIPPDGTEMEVISPISTVVVVIIYIGSAVGVIIAVICLCFNIIFRNRKIVRLTSPNINYITIVGALMLYLATCFSVLPTTNLVIWDGFCKTIAVFSSLGFSLTLGPVIAKVWRIYYIFRNPTAKKKRVSDWFLLLIIAVFAGISILLIIIGYSIPMCLPQAYTQPDASRQPSRDDRGIRTRHVIISCFPDECDAWVTIIFAYLGILQLTAFIFAVLIRKVAIPVLNESKEISAIIYLTTILVFEMLIFSLLLGQYNDLQEGLLNSHLILATTVVLLFLFVPKMIALYKDPLGENIFTQNTVQQASSLGVEAVVNKEKIHVLQRRVTALQEELLSAKSSRLALKDLNMKDDAYLPETINSPGTSSMKVMEYPYGTCMEKQESPV